MNLTELIEIIKLDKNCEVKPANKEIILPTNIPNDLKEFYELTNGIKLFENEAYGITIVGREEFIPTNKHLFSDDVNWEELEKEVCNKWYLVAKVDEMSQYISIDLTSERNGQCYDSYYETHSLQGDSEIIAKNFTELVTKLYQNKGQHWYWLQDDFEKLGDAYDEPISENKVEDLDKKWFDFTLKFVEKLSSNNEDWNVLSEKEQELAALWKLEMDMYNGGFLQFFCNWGYTCYLNATRSLERMNAEECLNIIQTQYKIIQRLEGNKEIKALWDLPKFLKEEELTEISEVLDRKYWGNKDNIIEKTFKTYSEFQ
jgi:hypothetical protein